MGAICIVIGAFILSKSNEVYENVTRYDVECKDKFDLPNREACSLKVKLEKDIKGPVYVYYQLTNFYQNHRSYVKSRSYDQTRGNYLEPKKMTDCDPIMLVGDLADKQRISVSGKKMNKEWPAIPCGLIAKSIFNDHFTFWKKESDTKKVNQTIDITDIAWESDVKHKFHNIEKSQVPTDLKFEDGSKVESWKDIQWLDMENQHFIVWMRTAGLPDFRKLWGKIDGGLTKGDYELEVINKFNTAPFNGTKSFVLATTTAIGGKNDFLGYSFVILGFISLIVPVVFALKVRKDQKND